MKSVKKKYVFGFLLIILIGIGMLILGSVLYGRVDDYVETEAYVVSVITRRKNGSIEYKPFLLRYVVDGKVYDTSPEVWFQYPIHQGDFLTMWYKKGDPNHTLVSNADKKTLPIALMISGDVLIFAGFVLECKYLYDVKRRKKVLNKTRKRKI